MQNHTGLGKPTPGGSAGKVHFAAMTAVALVAEAFLLVLFRWDPAMRGGFPAACYLAMAICLLPWLAGSVYLARVGKRATLGDAQWSVAHAYRQAVFTIVVAAYLAVLSVGMVLLQASVSAK